MENQLKEAAKRIRHAKKIMAFTGAGISVESGIPPFRGEHGLWNKYDPGVLNLDYYLEKPEECWIFIREIFYDFFDRARPNRAHEVLARMEREGTLFSVVTQNIDNLHYEAGNQRVHEFHGNAKRLVCRKCGAHYPARKFDLNEIPPRCPVDGEILKPDFIFFGEGIPPLAYERSFEDAGTCDLCIIVGSTGEVTPASYVPRSAKQSGATILEINPAPSLFTSQITDIHIKGSAGEIFSALEKIIF